MALNLTKGNPTKLLLRFIAPMLVSTIFQQFYNVADTMIVGRYVGADALAAVGTTGNITNLMLMLMGGATSGVSVVVAQIYGSGNTSKMRQSVATSFILVSILAIVLGGLGIVLTRPLLGLINVPENVIPDAMTYMRIILAGALASGLYNMSSSLLRAMGDSVTPLVFLVISGILNVIMNLVFVAKLGLGVHGVAIATIIATAISAVLCMIYDWPMLRFGLKDMKLDLQLTLMIAKIGVPSSLMSSTVNIGMIMIQALVNTYGATVMAAYTLGLKMESLFNCISFSLAGALQIFAAQNVGAGDYQRVREGFKAGLKLALGYVAIAGPCLLIFGKAILGLFTPDNPEVIRIAYQYCSMIAVSYPFVVVLITTRNTMHGAGDAMIPFVMGMFELVSRFICSYFLSIPLGYIGVFLGTPLAWITACIMGVIRYRSGKWMTKRLKIDS